MIIEHPRTGSRLGGGLGLVLGLALLWAPLLPPEARGAPLAPPDSAGVSRNFRYLFGLGPDQASAGQLEVRNSVLNLDQHVAVGWPDSPLKVETRLATGDLDGDGRDEVVVGFAASTPSGLPAGRFQVLDDDYSHWCWGQVDWPDYNAVNGETRPAVGDVDGDGKAEIFIGLGPGGDGLIQIFRLGAAGVEAIGWTDINWSDYGLDNGETWPALGDIDGDGKAELVIGFGNRGGGTFLVKKTFDESLLAAGLDPWRDEFQGNLAWSDYAKRSGETRPAVGDLNGDRVGEIVLGLGPSGGGNLEIFDVISSTPTYRTTLGIDWPEYNSLSGETRPAIGDIDDDQRGEIIVGLGAGGGGYVDLFEDALAGFSAIDSLRMGSADYQRLEGSSWPAIQREGGDSLQPQTNQSVSVAATTLTYYQLLLQQTGSGNGTLSGGGTFPAGTPVTPSATPADGSTFAGWSPTSCGSPFSLAADTTCTATFTLLPRYTLTAKISGTGTVTSEPAGIYCGLSCTASYANTKTVTLTPTPAIGQQFTGWSGACSGTASCVVAMTAARSVTAGFKPITGYAERGITGSQTDAGQRQVQPLSQGPARYVETHSARALTLGFDSLDLTVATADAAAYSLSASADPAYASPRAALRVGGDRQAVGFDVAQQPLVETRLHLLFPQPLQPGVDYHLEACAALGGASDPQAPCHRIPVRYEPERVSGSIQVDQVGYAPATPKIAFLGNWLGTAGPLPLDATAFEVIDDASGAVVFTGQARLTAAADPWSGNDVHQADFSALDRPGRYRLRVPGLGVSDPFAIAADVYDAPYRAVMRLFYHSRNSTPVVAPWAEPGYERPQGGVPAAMDAAFHAAVASSPLSAGSTTDTGPEARHPVRRGWFDAGDYGQYVPNAAPLWFLVGAAFDLAPNRFQDGDLNIPESGNGIPDVLDELEWGLDWLLSMQDPADGGVWFRVASRTWDSVPPHLIATPRLLAEKTSHATAAFAAACALHARLIRPYRPERADQALAAARRAWQFLTTHADWPAEGQLYKNPSGVSAGDYADATLGDNRLWAAAELLRTTGEATYRTAFETLLPQVKIDPTRIVSFNEFTLAGLWAYLLTNDPGRNASLVTKARTDLIAGADWRIRMAKDNPYRVPTHHAMGLAGWGSLGVSTRAAFILMQAYRLTGKADYLDWAWQSPHYQLGANPQSLSYLSGFGARSPRYPLNKLTKNGVVGAPIQGIPILGPHFYLPALWREMVGVNNSYLPPVMTSSALPTDPAEYLKLYPVMRRYTDSRGVPPMSEPTVSDYAQVGITFGLLRRGGLKQDIDALGKVPQ